MSLPAVALRAHPHAASRMTAILVMGTLTLHLLVAGRFDLGVDEAHYALYGLNPDWSYFDHPPMVGWLQAIALYAGNSEFVLRLWPMALALGSSVALYRLTRLLFPAEGAWVAFGAVAVLHSAILFQLVSMAMVPEDPLLLFGLLSAIALFRAVHDDRIGDWLALGVTFGLAGLSKYTAVTLVISALLVMAVEGRLGLLRRPGPWIAAAIALLVIAPVLLWNEQHHWISFAYQMGHGAPDRHWDGERFLLAQLLQIFAYAPGIYLFGLIALGSAFREWGNSGVRYVVLLAAPPLLLFGWAGGLEVSLPHWTLLSWALLAPLLARWVMARLQQPPVRYLAWGSLAYSLLLTLVIHSQLIRPWIPFEEHFHPLGDLYGWRGAAKEGLLLRDEMAREGGDEPGLFVGNWSLASRIAWYSRRPVWVTDDRFDQFDLWFGAPNQGARGLLIVADGDYQRPDINGTASFEQCREVGEQPYLLQGKEVHSFHFFACNGYRSMT